MSEMSEAFTELIDAQAESLGERKKVLIGRKSYDALIQPIPFDPSFVAGGEAESGQFQVSIAKSDLGKEPKKFTPVTIPGAGKVLAVLAVSEVNGVTYEITAGDPTADQQ